MKPVIILTVALVSLIIIFSYKYLCLRQNVNFSNAMLRNKHLDVINKRLGGTITTLGNTYISTPLKNKTSVSKVLSPSIKIPSHSNGNFTKEAKIVQFEALVIDFLLIYALGDVDELYWALISYDKYAPWVRKIWMVGEKEDHKLPYKNLPTNITKKLVFVDRCTLLDKNNCPTQNSFAVMTGIHKIKGLSETFVLVEDDTFFSRPVNISELFPGGKAAIYRKGPTWSWAKGKPHRIYRKVPNAVKKMKLPLTAAPTPHYANVLRKSAVTQMANEYPEFLNFVQSHKTRYSTTSEKNSQEECVAGVWNWYHLTTGAGVYVNIDNGNDKPNKYHTEVWKYDYSHFKDALSHKRLFVNINDRWSNNKSTKQHQVSDFHKALQEFFQYPLMQKEV